MYAYLYIYRNIDIQYTCIFQFGCIFEPQVFFLAPQTSAIQHPERKTQVCTPPKTKMAPENGPLIKDIPVRNHHF